MTQKSTSIIPPITKILIANRGEIAARVMRTCQKMGIRSVSVYSEADRDLDFVTMADESVLIGPAAAKDSYLNIPKIIEVCQRLNVDAVHPGYGFLSENADFAQALQDAGIRFIGPNSTAIRAMGSKSEAKALAEQAKIPTIPGYRGEDQSLDTLLVQAQLIGYPILIKATHGGGGKGMRRVDTPAEFEMALSACQREAQSAFSNSAVMLEKYVLNPRHIEVQIFGDTLGHVVALSERDCSLQRRHQKIIEEAPAVGLSDALRASLHRDAIAIAKAVQYTGAGTVEFLVSADESYYFLEMNTRLQVEHPVTEMVLGLDLVEWQIRVARGEPLPLNEAPEPKGHALEVRLYAEDPYAGFLPSTGLITEFNVSLGENIRLDAGFRAGNRVTIHYDPMLAKLIVHGENRRAAYALLAKTLTTVSLAGINSNRDFLLRLCHMPEVIDQLPDIGFLDRSLETILAQPPLTQEGIILLGVGLLGERGVPEISRMVSPWELNDDWRGCGLTQTRIAFRVSHPGNTAAAGEGIHVLSRYAQGWSLDGLAVDLNDWWSNTAAVGCQLGEQNIKADRVRCASGTIELLMGGCLYGAEILDIDHQQEDGAADQSQLNAPMPGRVISVLVTEGQTVEAGAPLVILEAMKMEHTIRAPYPGIVEQVFFATGDFVEEGAELTRVRAA